MSDPALSEVLRTIARDADDPVAAAEALERAWTRAIHDHPTITVDPGAFARHVVRHIGALPKEIDAATTAGRASELLLALACGQGSTRALETFERAHFHEVPAFVAHVGLSPSELADALQAIRERILAPRSGGAKILEFSGRGPLGGWLRVTAVRVALTIRAKQDTARSDDVIARASVDPDPELLLARLDVAKAFKAAFEASFAALTAEQRTVLRMHFVDGLTIDEIGVAYHVHRATAARWLAAGREAVAKGTRKHLREALEVDARDLESIFRLVDSQLDLSLHRILNNDDG